MAGLRSQTDADSLRRGAGLLYLVAGNRDLLRFALDIDRGPRIATDINNTVPHQPIAVRCEVLASFGPEQNARFAARQHFVVAREQGPCARVPRPPARIHDRTAGPRSGLCAKLRRRQRFRRAAGLGPGGIVPGIAGLVAGPVARRRKVADRFGRMPKRISSRTRRHAAWSSQSGGWSSSEGDSRRMSLGNRHAGRLNLYPNRIDLQDF